KIGARNISESLSREESSLLNDGGVKLKHVDPNDIFNLKGLVKLILGFLACSSLEMEPKKRHEAVQSLLSLSFHETKEPINKMDRDGSDSMKHATNFSEAIAEGVLREYHDHVPALSELIRIGFFEKFKNEEIDFLMDSKNLQIEHEDEEFLRSAFASG
ncbi:sacsin, partial [Trifolium medium]|nr:sacsin [Trifolium medium]